MENKVLPKPAVAGILAQKFVEARLHTDGHTNLARILELQETLARSVANPIYVIVDPAGQVEVARFEGAALTPDAEKRFIAFLEGASDKVATLDR